MESHKIMQSDFSLDQAFGPPPPQRRGIPVWAWFIIGGTGTMVLACGGVFGFLVYVGVEGPETSVYVGSSVPQKYLDTARAVNALEDGELVDYFYSDQLMDIRGGFYMTTDRRVVVYREAVGEPLISVPYSDIARTDLSRDESFFEDSQIELELENGQLVSFPVSSEHDRDVHVHEKIMERMEQD